jgi:hypothetical protein
MPAAGDMAAMMNNPMMQAMLNNPDMLRGILHSHPGVRQVGPCSLPPAG